MNSPFNNIFVQLFGEDDPDQDVSPDTEDPEAAGDQAGAAATEKEGTEVGRGGDAPLLTLKRGGRKNLMKFFLFMWTTLECEEKEKCWFKSMKKKKLNFSQYYQSQERLMLTKILV